MTDRTGWGRIWIGSRSASGLLPRGRVAFLLLLLAGILAVLPGIRAPAQEASLRVGGEWLSDGGFEEDRDANGLPDHWERYWPDPALFAHYGEAVLESDAPMDGALTLALHGDGTSVAIRTVRAVEVTPYRNYRLRGTVETRTRGRVRAEVWIHWSRGPVAAPLLEVAWSSVEAGLARIDRQILPPEGAVSFRIACVVLQDPLPGEGPDLQGGARFDALSLVDEPRLRVWVGRPWNLFREGEPVPLDVEAAPWDSTTRSLRIEATDVHGRPLGRIDRPLSGGEPDRLSGSLALPAGPFTIRARLLDGEQTVAEQILRGGVLAPGTPRGEDGIGLFLTGPAGADPEEAADLLRRLGLPFVVTRRGSPWEAIALRWAQEGRGGWFRIGDPPSGEPMAAGTFQPETAWRDLSGASPGAPGASAVGGRWVSLRGLDTPEALVARGHEVLDAWRAGVRTFAVPIDEAVGPQGDVRPGMILLHHLHQRLAGRAYGGSFEFLGKPNNWVLRRDGGRDLVFWDDRPGVMTLYLGDDVEVRDFFGGRESPIVEDARMRVPIGPLPRFMVNLDEPLVETILSFQMESSERPPRQGAVPLGLRFTNHFQDRAFGGLRIEPPERWRAAPAEIPFDIRGESGWEGTFGIEASPYAATDGTEQMFRFLLVFSRPSGARAVEVFKHLRLREGAWSVKVQWTRGTDGTIRLQQILRMQQDPSRLVVSYLMVPGEGERTQGIGWVRAGESREATYLIPERAWMPGMVLGLREQGGTGAFHNVALPDALPAGVLGGELGGE
ncbi:MAG: hypothetical protein HY608_00370 [Planctomycetes bacterium]|nr:hypothetical protein [Planctomycetota bacterium]